MKALLLALMVCVPVSAGTAKTGLPSCAVQVTNVPTIRHEGLTELAADIVLSCTGGPPPTAAGQPVPMATATITFSIPVSNPHGVEALLAIDEPAPANQVAGVFNGPAPLGVGGNGLNFAGGSTANIFPGVQNGPNSFLYVFPFDNSPNGRTFTFTNIFVDPNAKPSSSLNPQNVEADAQIKVNFSNIPAGQTLISPATANMGTTVDCFVYQANGGSAPANKPLNTSLLGSNPVVPSSPSATLLFSNLFPGCFRVRTTGFQNVFGQANNTDAGFTSQAFPPGLANVGTQFQAVFNNIPAGVSLFTESTVTNALGTIKLTSPGTPLGSTGLTNLTISGSTSTAIWEVMSANPTATATFSVPVYVAFQPGVPAPTNITVVQSLGSPPGGVSFAPPASAVLPPIAFSINSGASTTPAISAQVDPRACYIGPPFFSGNACSPQNGLFVNVFSDTASVSQNMPTFTPSGNLTESVLTSFQSTPTRSQVFMKPGSASPGVYPLMMNITAQGAANTLSLPVTVTLLPADNPILELGSIADAFSYQSGFISPGQIFTAFGNFGPSSLVSGILDSSGKLSTMAGNTQFLFDGIPAPILYAANGQASAVAPFELTGKTSTKMQLMYNGLTSPAVAVPVKPSSISIASADGSGGNGGVIINPDGTLNTTSNPASDGDTVVIYAAYAGPFANSFTGTDGRTTISPPYPAPAGPVSVTFGGVPATNIPYFGNAPGFLESVMQINVAIPSGVTPNLYTPLVISAGGATSPPWITIAIH